MRHRPDLPHASIEIPESMIRAQLDRILSSEMFSRSERLSDFLRFIVDHTLDGDSSSLKEQVLAAELYHRGSDFDAAADAVVRVDARRLRDKLREYYSENAEDPVLITLPKGAYVPAFEGRREITAAGSKPHYWRLVAAAALVAAALGGTFWFLRPKALEPAPKLTPLTSYPGDEAQPSLSPDGNFVAFTCSEADKPGQSDICVKAVGAESFQKLTNTPESEYWPSWSPNGQEIAFGRGPSRFSPGFQEAGAEMGIYVMPLAGGPERKVSDTGNMVGWTPDGKSVLIRDRRKGEPFAIFQLDLDTLQRRRITQPPQGDGDWRFDVSPDGRTLAFIRFGRTTVGDLYVAPIEGGEPRRLTEWNRYLTGVSWTPDGTELVYSLDGRLWRISAGLTHPGRGSPIPNIPMPAIGLSISRPRAGRAARLAFRTSRNQNSLRRIDLSSAVHDGTISGIEPFAPATRSDTPGRFSPDGTKVAFVSNRSSENPELWIADSDGGRPRQITALGSAARMLAGSWSPNGKQILFDAEIQGSDEIYVISVDGGNPVRLTLGPAVDGLPEWSKDSRWIYYASPAKETIPNIWRMPAQGGTSERLTNQGGFEPQVSPDGQHLYYLDRPPSAGTARLLRMTIDGVGGEGHLIHDGMSPFLWSVTNIGIYFLKTEDRVHSVHLYRFASQKIERVGSLPFRLPSLQSPGRFTVASDGRWALVNVAERSGGDLMLIDDFR